MYAMQTLYPEILSHSSCPPLVHPVYRPEHLFPYSKSWLVRPVCYMIIYTALMLFPNYPTLSPSPQRTKNSYICVLLLGSSDSHNCYALKYYNDGFLKVHFPHLVLLKIQWLEIFKILKIRYVPPWETSFISLKFSPFIFSVPPGIS